MRYLKNFQDEAGCISFSLMSISEWLDRGGHPEQCGLHSSKASFHRVGPTSVRPSWKKVMLIKLCDQRHSALRPVRSRLIPRCLQHRLPAGIAQTADVGGLPSTGGSVELSRELAWQSGVKSVKRSRVRIHRRFLTHLLEPGLPPTDDRTPVPQNPPSLCCSPTSTSHVQRGQPRSSAVRIDEKLVRPLAALLGRRILCCRPT